MSDINLLPIDLSPNSSSAKTANSLKRFTIILAAIFLLVSVSGILLIVLLSRQSQEAKENKQALEQEVQSLLNSEQTLFLVKDRISKIKLSETQKNRADDFDQVITPLLGLPSEITVSSIDIDASKNQFTVLSKTSIDMASFINSLVTSGTYKSLNLTNFTFSPDIGYSITLNISS
jgi:preprotein translocase subunit SecG